MGVDQERREGYNKDLLWQDIQDQFVSYVEEKG